MKKVLVFGSINIDLVFDVKQLPLKGQTIFSKKYETFFGGKGANQAVALGKMGSKPTMIGQVGLDPNGKEAILNLNKNNVQTSLIKQHLTLPTGVAGILVDENADNVIIVESGSNMAFTADDAQNYLEEIKNHDIILSQLEIPLEFVFAVFKEAKKLGKITVLNPAPGTKLTEEQIKSCDFIIPNETELALVLGEEISEDYEEIKRQAIKLQQISGKHVITTLGKNGSLYVGPNKILKIDAIKVNAVDATSAGDTFIGAFIHMQANNKTIEESIELANYAAALTVTETGAQPSIPTFELVEMFKESYNSRN